MLVDGVLLKTAYQPCVKSKSTFTQSYRPPAYSLFIDEVKLCMTTFFLLPLATAMNVIIEYKIFRVFGVACKFARTKSFVFKIENINLYF